MKLPNTSDSLSVLLALAALSSPLAADDGPLPLRSETYGVQSGDVPMRGMGLVLELVDAGTERARLRLFGGMPGHRARILVSTERATRSGPRESTLLVGDVVTSLEGTFNWEGTYEVSVDGLTIEQGVSLYAQGLHEGWLEFGRDDPSVQLSHGLELQVKRKDDPLRISDLGLEAALERLPEYLEPDDQGKSLAQRLQTRLNSVGDSVRIAFELKGAFGAGAEGVGDIKQALAVPMELHLERTDEDLYELTLAAELAQGYGIGVGTGFEAGALYGFEYGGSLVLRFCSAQGAARAILGMLLINHYPDLAMSALESVKQRKAEEIAETLRVTVDTAKAKVDELDTAWQELDEALAATRAYRSDAKKSLKKAKRNYDEAGPKDKPHWAKEIAERSARLATAEIAVTAGQNSVDAARRALEAGQLAFEEKQDDLADLLRWLARLARIRSAIGQTATFSRWHLAGFEIRAGTFSELEAKLQVPVVSPGSLGAGSSLDRSLGALAFFELATTDRAAQLTIQAFYEIELSAYAVLLGGGKAELTHVLEHSDSYTFDGGLPSFAGRTARITTDACALGVAGALATMEVGIGRQKSMWITSNSALAMAADAIRTLRGEGEFEGPLHTEIGLEKQHRYERRITAELGVEFYAALGGALGFEMEIAWSDQGEPLTMSGTIREGIENLVERTQDANE